MKDNSRVMKPAGREEGGNPDGLFFDHNPLPMWVYDLETYRFLTVNRAAVRHYGYSKDEFLAMTIKDIRPSEDVSRLIENVEHVTEGIDEAGVWRHKKKDGSLIFVEIVSHTMQFDDRDAELVVAMDVTERMRAEKAFQESESRYHRLAENAPDLIYRYEFAPKRGFTYVSPSALEITGYTPEEHYADPDLGFKLVHPDDRHLLEAAARGEMPPGQPLVLRWVRKDGSIVWTEQRNVPVFVEGGKMVAIEGIARDITERKHSEQSLEESEERYRRIVETAHEGIWVIDSESTTTFVNRKMADLLGYTVEEMTGVPLFAFMDDEGRAIAAENVERRRKGIAEQHDFKFHRKDGTDLWALLETNPIQGADGNYLGALAMITDITERKQAEQALEQSQAQLQGIIDSAMDAILAIDADQRILLFNPAAERMYKCAAGEAIGQPLTRFIPEYVRDLHGEFVRTFGRSHASKRSMETPTLELICLRADGEMFPSEVSISQLDLDGRKLYTAIVRDVTERKRAEASLRLQSAALEATVNGIVITDREGNIQWVNAAYTQLTGYPLEEVVGKNPRILGSGLQDKTFYEKMWNTILSGKAWHGELVNKRKDGSLYNDEMTITPLVSAGGEITHFIGVKQNISERKQAEQTLRLSEDRYRDLVENIHDLIGTHDLQGNILTINAAAAKLLGMENGALLNMNLRDLLVPEVRGQFDDYLNAIQRDGQAKGLMYVQAASGERRIWDYDNTLRINTGGAPIVRALARDVTESKRAEEALHESEARYRTIFDGVHDAILVESFHGNILAVNQRACEIYGYSRREFLTKTVTDLVPAGHTIITADTEMLSRPMETVNRRANGEVFPIEISGRIETINGEAALLVVARDITDRKQAEEKIHRQLDYLTALREIDHAIASTIDLRLNLDTLLSRTVSLLAVDAAAILLVNSTLNTLHYTTGKGFRTRAAKTAEVKLGESYAGRAALERRMVQISDIAKDPQNPLLGELIKEEKFVSYHRVPLIAKGKVIGVLEIYNRRIVKRDQEWLDFLNTLAGQAAIAIDNAQLFERMQSYNTELRLAYDATIEGWSRAMDMRDKETEGHTLRVTELTLKLASIMGISLSDLIHIRRGALLHDIGKMGIPDHILLKSEKLTDEEWQVMRMHPIFAYEMLEPIGYLQAALNIPYCHHEKWDGSGYPRGLAGEQIPLDARIFAVVDVWDALTSDRPYRPAWTKEKSLDYIREHSGMHFDPQVVTFFLKMFE